MSLLPRLSGEVTRDRKGESPFGRRTALCGGCYHALDQSADGQLTQTGRDNEHDTRLDI